jgi:hypothetical protein
MDASRDFPSDYMDPYVKFVWEYYGKDGYEIKVDCSEEINVVPGITKRNCIFTGSVVDGVNFQFKNCDGNIQNVTPIPTSQQVFDCDGGPMHPANKTILGVLAKNLGAALNIGLLPQEGSPTLCKKFFLDNAASFYQPNPLVPASIGNGPWNNHYSAFMHSYGYKVYAFAFDDVAGQDSTLHSDGAAPFTVTICDLTGTTAIDPDNDPNLYDLTFMVGSGAAGTAVNPHDGKSYSLESGPPITVNNFGSPFDLTYDTGKGPEKYKVYVALQAVEPFLGIVFNGTSPNISLSLPGVPR